MSEKKDKAHPRPTDDGASGEPRYRPGKAGSESHTEGQGQEKTCDNAKRPEPAPEASAPDAARRLTVLVLVFLFLALTLHVLSDKYIPYTSNGRVKAFVLPVVPQVSGNLVKVEVENNQLVRQGEVLAVIDPVKYQLAVAMAEAELQSATQATAADVAAVAAAQAKVAEARANLRNAEIKGRRIIRLSRQGAASKARADDARTRIEACKAQLQRALSELEQARSRLGAEGKENPRVKAALAALEAAQLDLSHTVLTAPSDGVITNLTVDVGHYAKGGSPIMTFIASRFLWIQADMRENCLANIDPGDPVEVVLDAVPGRVFQAEVMSIGYGVTEGASSSPGSLTAVQPNQGWLRQAQHMPVLISLEDETARAAARVGGQANVMIFTGDRPLLNALGRLWIRTVALFSHVY